MYFNSRQTSIRSIIVLIVIFTVGFMVLGNIQSKSTLSIKTDKLYYYNLSKDTLSDGVIECNMNSVLPINRMIAVQATTSDMFVQNILINLLYTSLNPIEEINGFTRNNIPEDIFVKNFLLIDEIATVTLGTQNTKMSECENNLLTEQITLTLNYLPDVSTTTVIIIDK